MEKETGNRDQISRSNDIEAAYDSFTAKKEQWEKELASISNAVSDMSDFAIARIRIKINSENNGWECDDSGAIECEYVGTLLDLDVLTELIVYALN